MDDTNQGAVERQLDRELQLVVDAIAMVSSGASPRVTVAGLRLGSALLEPAEELARTAGVRIVPRWSADESGVDIAVERPLDTAAAGGAGGR
ncbi:MAG TPA: hypothetical protein VID95_11680 [Candidatus Limnocylindrales bacterium]|jgi:hypothetical protein